MVEAPAVVSIFLTFLIPIFGFRLAVFRKRVDDLQKSVGSYVDSTYAEFEAVIFATKKRDRDPEKALGLAAKYHSWKRHEGKLFKTYNSIKRNEKIDVLGIILSISAIVMTYFFTSVIYPHTITILVGLALFITIFSVFTIVRMYRYVDKLGDAIGMGQPTSSH